MVNWKVTWYAVCLCASDLNPNQYPAVRLKHKNGTHSPAACVLLTLKNRQAISNHPFFGLTSPISRWSKTTIQRSITTWSAYGRVAHRPPRVTPFRSLFCPSTNFFFSVRFWSCVGVGRLRTAATESEGQQQCCLQRRLSNTTTTVGFWPFASHYYSLNHFERAPRPLAKKIIFIIIEFWILHVFLFPILIRIIALHIK